MYAWLTAFQWISICVNTFRCGYLGCVYTVGNREYVKKRGWSQGEGAEWILAFQMLMWPLPHWPELEVFNLSSVKHFKFNLALTEPVLEKPECFFANELSLLHYRLCCCVMTSVWKGHSVFFINPRATLVGAELKTWEFLEFRLCPAVLQILPSKLWAMTFSTRLLDTEQVTNHQNEFRDGFMLC